MFDLNYVDDMDGISPEAAQLMRRGVVITKLYKAIKGTQMKVNSRLDFDVTKDLCLWYIYQRFGAKHANVNIGDWYDRGDLLFTFTEYK